MTFLRETNGPRSRAVLPPAAFGAADATSTAPAGQRVVIVDDDEMILDLICSIAEIAGCAAIPVRSMSKLDEYLADSRPSDLIFLDLNLGDTDGVSVLRRLHERSCKSSIFVVSGCEDRVRRSAVDFGRQLGLTMLAPMAKPFDHAQTVDAIRRFANVQGPLTETDVRSALEKCEFSVHMQPIIEIKTRRVVAAEALVRWLHSVRGMIYPDKFIPMLEQRPLMLPLTLDVARLAFGAVASLPGSVSVGINVPPICLGDTHFPDLLTEVAGQHRIPPSRVELEITETAAMADPVFTAAQVTRLRIKGFKVALDDFGTGYASLVELHRMPVSAIKIDRSFVMQLLRDKDASAIVRSIIGLGRNLDLRVIAEGVENQETLEFLRSWDCELAQGYHIARPMPADALAGWLASWEEKLLAHTFD